MVSPVFSIDLRFAVFVWFLRWLERMAVARKAGRSVSSDAGTCVAQMGSELAAKVRLGRGTVH